MKGSAGPFRRFSHVKYYAMKTTFIFWFAFLLLTGLQFYSCKEDCTPPLGTAYKLEIPITLTPAQDTFHVGDTITIVSSFSNCMYEKDLDQFFTIENWQFFPTSKVSEISSNPAKSAMLDFNIIIDSIYDYEYFYYANNEVDLSGEYLNQSNIYDLKYRLIPSKTGVYHFRHLVDLDFIRSQTFIGKCKNERVEAFVNMNEDADNNIHYLSLSPDPHYNTWILIKPELRFHKFGGYCFVVVE